MGKLAYFVVISVVLGLASYFFVETKPKTVQEFRSATITYQAGKGIFRNKMPYALIVRIDENEKPIWMSFVDPGKEFVFYYDQRKHRNYYIYSELAMLVEVVNDGRGSEAAGP